jgi:4-hydroxy-3-polyprenylbenzoate decarboxylase
MHGLWGQGQMSFCKVIVVVDEDTDLGNPAAILEELLRRLDTESDLSLTRGVLDVLDHSSPIPNFGNKIGIDLTSRFPGEPARGKPVIDEEGLDENALKDRLKKEMEGVVETRLVSVKPGTDRARNRILLLAVKRGGNNTGKTYAEKLLAERISANIIILFDENIELRDDSLVLWKLFNNVDPGRDLFMEGSRMIVDACMKRPEDGHEREWPDELTFDE